jgi:hypothetical protein
VKAVYRQYTIVDKSWNLYLWESEKTNYMIWVWIDVLYFIKLKNKNNHIFNNIRFF